MPKFMFKFMISVTFCLTLCVFTPLQTTAQTIDPLSAWSEGENKDRIKSFVKGVTTLSAPEYRPKNERIAIFDMDGTLINQSPHTFALLSVLPFRPCPYEAKLASENPETKLPTNADFQASNYNIRDIFRLWLACASTHGTKSFTSSVDKTLNDMMAKGDVKIAYLPMQQFVAYLKANDFTVYMSTGSPVEIARVIGKTLFDLPPAQVIGSETVYSFDLTKPDDPIRLNPKLGFLNLEDGKVFSAQQRIGKSPIIAAGNGDGDLAFMNYVALQPQSLIMVIDHDHYEAQREEAFGTHDNLAKTAIEKKWLLISIKNDFKEIFKK